jgi:hypothetical protein
MKPMVVIGFAEALSAPEVAWSLVDAGFEILAIARRGRRAALRHSAHVVIREITAPEVDVSAATRELGEVLKGLAGVADRVVAVLPLDDTAIWICSQIELPPGQVMVGPKAQAVEFALKKRIQVEAAVSAGFNVPATTIATTPAEVFSRQHELPLVLRPAEAVLCAQGRLQKGRNWTCATELELQQAVDAWAGAWPVLVQPYVRGAGEGVFGLATGERIEAWSAHRRLRMMNPHGSGSSACISQAVPEETRVAAENLIQRAGWRGLFMIELLRDVQGKYWFIEFNGRPWGSMALSRRQGFEYPAWAVSWTLDPKALPAMPAARPRPVICRNLGRELLHLMFVARGPKSKALTHWPSLWRTTMEMFRIHRSDSLYNWRRDDLKVFVRDSWYTVRSNLFKSNG